MKDIRFFNVTIKLINTSVKIGDFRGGGGAQNLQGDAQKKFGALTSAKHYSSRTPL